MNPDIPQLTYSVGFVFAIKMKIINKGFQNLKLFWTHFLKKKKKEMKATPTLWSTNTKQTFISV